VAAIDDSNSQRFYHGTKVDLKPGDLIEPGYNSSQIYLKFSASRLN
jgi:hypothetical protein